MTKPRRPRRACEEPSTPLAPLTAFDLMVAPELAALAVLERAIDVAWIALLAQHVDLLDPDAPFMRAPRPGANVAMPLFKVAHALTLVIRRYRAAVAEAAASHDPSRDGFGPVDPRS